MRRALLAIIQILPKLGLPNLLRRAAAVRQLGDQFARRPCFYPIRAVHQILVKHISKLPRKLIGSVIAIVEIRRKSLTRGGKIGRLRELGGLKQREQSPAHHFG